MISEDHVTEDWRNDAENTEINSKKKKKKSNIFFEMVIIFHNITVFTTFPPKKIIAALVGRGIKKNLTDPKHL